MTKPLTFWVLVLRNGHVIGSAYESALDVLAEEAPVGSRIEKIDREEWDKQAKLCLLGRCEHAGWVS